IAGHSLLLRIPRFSQWGAAPADQLAYEQAAFRQAHLCGHVPALHATLPVTGQLPTGALIVERILGRPPRLPHDLGKLATALAALHACPLPPVPERAPLLNQNRPFAATMAAIEAQAADLPGAGLNAEARTAIDEELSWAREYAGEETADFPVLALVGTDTHPGNFLIDNKATAWFIDLEKTLYGAPPIDLAHATLLTSTGWDPDCAIGQLSPAHIRGFYTTYLEAAGPARARLLRPWLMPMRRLTWLRTMTWFARWRTRWSNQTQATGQTRRVTTHIARHIATCFEPTTIRASRREWHGLDTLHLDDI
ncbi:MAG: phosphotransferase, partial [Alphaproteobacteria bacterium]